MSPDRRCRRRPSLLTRVRDWWDLRRGRLDRVLARFDPLGGPGGETDGGVGVREPRRPVRPHLSGAVALDVPETDG
jgi:hypothetical protein